MCRNVCEWDISSNWHDAWRQTAASKFAKTRLAADSFAARWCRRPTTTRTPGCGAPPRCSQSSAPGPRWPPGRGAWRARRPWTLRGTMMLALQVRRECREDYCRRAWVGRPGAHGPEPKCPVKICAAGMASAWQKLLPPMTETTVHGTTWTPGHPPFALDAPHSRLPGLPPQWLLATTLLGEGLGGGVSRVNSEYDEDAEDDVRRG